MKQDYDDRDAPPDVPAPSVDEAIKGAIERTVRKNWGPGFENWSFEGPQPKEPHPAMATIPTVASQFERRQRGEVRQTGPWAPDVPKPPAFISLGGGVHAKRDAILATYANEAGGTIALFVGGNYINGPRPHAEFVKELLEGA